MSSPLVLPPGMRLVKIVPIKTTLKMSAADFATDEGVQMRPWPLHDLLQTGTMRREKRVRLLRVSHPGSSFQLLGLDGRNL